jgi:hypothetical protein
MKNARTGSGRHKPGAVGACDYNDYNKVDNFGTQMWKLKSPSEMAVRREKIICENWLQRDGGERQIIEKNGAASYPRPRILEDRSRNIERRHGAAWESVTMCCETEALRCFSYWEWNALGTLLYTCFRRQVKNYEGFSSGSIKRSLSLSPVRVWTQVMKAGKQIASFHLM